MIHTMNAKQAKQLADKFNAERAPSILEAYYKDIEKAARMGARKAYLKWYSQDPIIHNILLETLKTDGFKINISSGTGDDDTDVLTVSWE